LETMRSAHDYSEDAGGGIDMASLPTFGGVDVENSEEIWSWDDTHGA